MASNDHTLDILFDVLNGTDLSGTGVGTAHYHDSQYLIDNVFCSNFPSDPHTGLPPYPCIGVTDHGPQFMGWEQIKSLLDESFKSFDPYALLPQVSRIGKSPVEYSERLYSKSDAKKIMISVQCINHGTYVSKWFGALDKHGKKHAKHSPPISNIEPDYYKVMEIPVSAVFTFDGDCKIVQVSMYFDRYRLQQQLTSAPVVTPDVLASVVADVQAFATKALKLMRKADV